MTRIGMIGGAPAGTSTVLIHEWVTGGGLAGRPMRRGWAAEGHAMRRRIARDFACLPQVRVVVTLDARFPDEPGPWTVVKIEPQREGPPAVRRLASAVQRLAALVDYIVLIAPEMQGLHAGLARQVEGVGGRLLGSTAKAIGHAGHKLWLANHLARLGVAAPPSRRVIPAHGLPDSAAYPAVLKPVRGAGAVRTYKIDRPVPCPQGAKWMASAILQPFVPGTPMSASFLVDRDGRARLLGVGWQRIELRRGKFVYRGGRLPAPGAFAEGNPRRAVESVPGLRGFVGVDFLRDEATGETTVLEINPRLTTSYVGLAHLLPPGALARAWLAAVEDGEPIDLAPRIEAGPRITFDADGTIVGED
jgi:predicted ATP-grasp superfamily ATP-dependent carboligase